MTKKRNHRRHRAAAKQRPAREEVLMQVTHCLMEPIASQRVGKGLEMSSDTTDLMKASVARWARTDEEHEDLMQQACELAEDLLDDAWPYIEPLAREPETLVFRDPSTLPSSMLGQPLHPLPGASVPESTDLRQPRARDRHRVAHGIVGAVVCGRPISVGFSVWRLPGAAATDSTVQALLAGRVADMFGAHARGTHVTGDADWCACREKLIPYLHRYLGITAADYVASGAETFDDVLRALGREQDCKAYYDAQRTIAESLVERAITCGFLDGEAVRLRKLGRIVVDPSEAAAALGVSLAATSGGAASARPVSSDDKLPPDPSTAPSTRSGPRSAKGSRPTRNASRDHAERHSGPDDNKGRVA